MSVGIEYMHLLTRKKQVQSYFSDLQTHIQHTESTQPSATHVHRGRAADAADASTAAPDVRAPATESRKDRAVHVGKRPRPATQEQARPGPQQTAIDGRPLRAGAQGCGHSERLRWRRVAWRAATMRGSASTCAETHFLSAERRAQRMLHEGTWP